MTVSRLIISADGRLAVLEAAANRLLYSVQSGQLLVEIGQQYFAPSGQSTLFDTDGALVTLDLVSACFPVIFDNGKGAGAARHGCCSFGIG